jgi:hypothetical protein
LHGADPTLDVWEMPNLNTIVWAVTPLIFMVIAVVTFLRRGRPVPKVFLVVILVSMMTSVFAPQCLCVGLVDEILGALIGSVVFNLILFSGVICWRWGVDKRRERSTSSE